MLTLPRNVDRQILFVKEILSRPVFQWSVLNHYEKISDNHLTPGEPRMYYEYLLVEVKKNRYNLNANDHLAITTAIDYLVAIGANSYRLKSKVSLSSSPLCQIDRRMSFIYLGLCPFNSEIFNLSLKRYHSPRYFQHMNLEQYQTRVKGMHIVYSYVEVKLTF